MTKYKVTVIKFSRDFLTGQRVPRYKVVSIYAENEEDARLFVKHRCKLAKDEQVQSVEVWERK